MAGFLIGLPLLFISRLWGWRQVTTALVSAAYSFLLAATVLAAYGSQVLSLAVALLYATPGVFSLFAARQLRRENLARNRAR